MAAAIRFGNIYVHVSREHTFLEIGAMQLQLHRPQPKGRGGRRTDLPRAMSAAAIDRFGGPEVLTLHVLPVPAVDAGIRRAPRAFPWCWEWTALVLLRRQDHGCAG